MNTHTARSAGKKIRLTDQEGLSVIDLWLILAYVRLLHFKVKAQRAWLRFCFPWLPVELIEAMRLKR